MSSGNPRVTPEVTRDVCLLARMMAANLYFSQIEDLKKTVFQIHFKRTTAPVENPVEARTARRKIALMKTILRQRELEKQTPAENK